MKKAAISGGDDIRQPVRYKRGGQQNYSGTELLDVSYVAKKFAAIFQWKQKNFPIIISQLDELKNQGPERVISHVESETAAAREDALDSFGTGIYSAGTDSKDIDGAQIFLSTSNTYGGLSQSANSWWQAQIDSSTTALSLAKMQELYESCKEGPDTVDLMTFDETQFNTFWSTNRPIRGAIL